MRAPIALLALALNFAAIEAVFPKLLTRLVGSADNSITQTTDADVVHNSADEESYVIIDSEDDAQVFHKSVDKKPYTVVNYEDIANADIDEVPADDGTYLQTIPDEVMERMRLEVLAEYIKLRAANTPDEELISAIVDIVVEKKHSADFEIAKLIKEKEDGQWVMMKGDADLDETEIVSRFDWLQKQLFFLQSSTADAYNSPVMQAAIETIKTECNQRLAELIEYAKQSALRHGAQLATNLSPDFDMILKQDIAITGNNALKIVQEVMNLYKADVQAQGIKSAQDNVPRIVKVILSAAVKYYVPSLGLLL